MCWMKTPLSDKANSVQGPCGDALLIPNWESRPRHGGSRAAEAARREEAFRAWQGFPLKDNGAEETDVFSLGVCLFLALRQIFINVNDRLFHDSLDGKKYLKIHPYTAHVPIYCIISLLQVLN